MGTDTIIGLPVIYSARQVVEAGGLMSYGLNQADLDLDRRAATYVDKNSKARSPPISRGAAEEV